MEAIRGTVTEFTKFKKVINSFEPQFRKGDIVRFNLICATVNSILSISGMPYNVGSLGIYQEIDGEVKCMRSGIVTGCIDSVDISIRSIRSCPKCYYGITFGFEGDTSSFRIDNIEEENIESSAGDPTKNRFIATPKLIRTVHYYDDGTTREVMK